MADRDGRWVARSGSDLTKVKGIDRTTVHVGIRGLRLRILIMSA